MFSGWDTVKCDVSQGCVLGQLLMNIYVNDFPNIINKLSQPYCLLMIPVLLSHPLTTLN